MSSEWLNRRTFFTSTLAGTAGFAVAKAIPSQDAPAVSAPRDGQTFGGTGNRVLDKAAAMQPLPPTDVVSLNKIVQSGSAIAQPKLAGKAKAEPFPTEFLPIDTAINSDPDFGLDSILTASAQFKFWQVESLLDQAADLLDRCARERTEYDQLRTQWTRLFLEVTEFERYEEVHQDEIAAGWYSLNFVQSSHEAGALQALIQDPVGSTGWPEPDARNRGYVAAQALADTGFMALRNSAGLGQLREEMDHNHTTASLNRARVLEELGFRMQACELAAQADSVREQLAAKRSKEAFDGKDIDFRRRRSQAAVLLNDLKKKLMADPGAPYNYIEQGRPIRRRFMRDFRDAYLRLRAARDGLKNILNLSVQVPPFPEITAQTSAPGVFDEATLWNREAIRMLIALGHSDQAYALSLSLKNRVGQTQWNNAVNSAGSGSKVVFTFEFPADRLQGQSLVRLRGLSAFVARGNNSRGTWHMTIKPPKTATGPTGQPLNQVVPLVNLGSVDARDSERPAETVGTVVLRNVALIGHASASPADRSWRIEVDAVSSIGEKFSQVIQDIEVEFQVVSQVQA